MRHMMMWTWMMDSEKVAQDEDDSNASGDGDGVQETKISSWRLLLMEDFYMI